MFQSDLFHHPLSKSAFVDFQFITVLFFCFLNQLVVFECECVCVFECVCFGHRGVSGYGLS